MPSFPQHLPEPSDLPPLALLRAFDAAGRHLSFKAAASSLHVSASTISHQVADLEQYLGVQLFQRQTRGLSLTGEGVALLAEVSVAFSQLRAATTRLRTRGQPMVIRISANPFLASEILMPLIEAFELAFEGRSVHLSATEALEDPRDGGVDFCIRFGDGIWPGLERVALYPVSAVPVIAPSVRGLPALVDYPFRGQSAWKMWELRGGAVIPGNGIVRSFSSFQAAMAATAQGLGVSLAVWPVVQRWIGDGRLVLHDQSSVPLGHLDLLCRPLSPAQSTLRSVRDWLVAALRS